MVKEWHLPECADTEALLPIIDCICEPLRRCEQRMIAHGLVLIQQQQRLWAGDTAVRIGLGIAKATLHNMREDNP